MFFYLPIFYLFKTRLLGFSYKLAWVTTYVIPVSITFFLFGETSLILLVTIILSTFSIYEIGYIYNDLELIKRETNPTIRLNAKEMQFYEENKKSIYLSRFTSVILILAFSFWLFPNDFSYILLNVLAIGGIYIIYNNIRNEWNIVLYSLLVTLKYFGFIIFKYISFEVVIFLWLLYSCCSTIDFSTKKRFWTSRYIHINNYDKFRVIYYFIVGVFIFICGQYAYLEYYYAYLSICLYFLAYRIVNYIFLAKKLR